MKRHPKFLLILIFIIATAASAQSPTDDLSPAQNIRGYWVDPATRLMWAAKDNGKDVNWKNAIKYCRTLRLAGYSDWRLANMWELQPIFDITANAPGRAGQRNVTWHIKGDLFLTGSEWAYDWSKHSSGYHYYFDFNEGKSNDQPSGFPYPYSFMRALCVRGAEK